MKSRQNHPPAAVATERPHNWLDDLLTPAAVMGVPALLIQPWLVTVRAWEFAHVLTRANMPNAATGFSVLGHHLGMCEMLGLVLTLAQMISASLAIMESLRDTARGRCLIMLARSLLVVSCLLELSLSVLTATGPMEQSVGFAIALSLAVGEPMAGILVIDCLLIPAILWVGCALRNKFAPALLGRN